MKRLLCLVLMWSVPAFAQVSGEVKRYLHSAAALFEKLEYEKALAQIKRAKNKSQGQEDDTQISLYEGIVLAEMGDAQASTAFTTALGLEPNAKLPMVVSPKVQKVFDKSRASVLKLMEAQDAAEAARAEEAKKQEEASKPPPAEVKPEPVVVKRAPPPEPSHAMRNLGIGVGVAGVALAGTGGLMLGLAHGAGNQITSGQPETYAAAQALASTGKTEQTVGVALLAVGGAALVTGVVLAVLGSTGSSGASASAVVTPNGAYASLSIPLP